MSINPTYRCIAAAGPAAEVEWMIERVRGPFSRGSSKALWRPQLAFSIARLAELLPASQRPVNISDNIGASYSGDVWESAVGMMRAQWNFADQAFLDSDALECLLKRITERYPSVCWVSASEDPDTLEAQSELYWKGRVTRHVVPYREFKRLSREIYRRAGQPLEDDEDMNDPVADSFVDEALLDAAESFWDTRIERLLHRSFTKSRVESNPNSGCAGLEMTT
jgi:hypothetical protein